MVLFPYTTETFRIQQQRCLKLVEVFHHGIFEPRGEHPCNLRFISQFSAPLVSTVFHERESTSFLGSKIWKLLPETFKNIDPLEIFKILIRSGNLKIALVGQVYVKNVGFLQNKKLFIISQDNILIIEFNIIRFQFFIFLFHQEFKLSTALWWQGVLRV